MKNSFLEKASSIQLVRCYAFYSLHHSLSNEPTTINPIELITHERKYLLTRFSLNQAISYPEPPPYSSRNQREEIQNKKLHSFEEIVKLTNTKLLPAESLEWVSQKKRSRLITASLILAYKLCRQPFSSKNRPSFYNSYFNTITFQHPSNFKTGNLTFFGAHISQLKALTNTELYINLVTALDNLNTGKTMPTRVNFVREIQELCLELEKVTQKIQEKICSDTTAKGTEWLIKYLFKANHTNINYFNVVNLQSHSIEDTISTLRLIAFMIGKDGYFTFEQKILKAWSVKKTRKRSSIKNKPISLSQKDHDLLKFIATNREMGEKELIVSLLKDEEKRMKVYGICKKTR